jgi:hypothetical protein
VISSQGQLLKTIFINAKIVKIDVSSLRPGLYFLSAKKMTEASSSKNLLNSNWSVFILAAASKMIRPFFCRKF